MLRFQGDLFILLLFSEVSKSQAKMERLQVDDGELDLSMSQLEELPIKEIVS